MQRPVDDRGTGSPPSAAPRSGRSFAWVIIPVLAFTALVALFAFALTTGDPSRLPSALIGKPVPATAFPPLEGLLDAGKSVPAPAYHPDPVPMASGRFVTRLPKSIHAKLAERAKSEGVSLNTLVLAFIAEGLGRKDAHA